MATLLFQFLNIQGNDYKQQHVITLFNREKEGSLLSDQIKKGIIKKEMKRRMVTI